MAGGPGAGPDQWLEGPLFPPDPDGIWDCMLVAADKTPGWKKEASTET